MAHWRINMAILRAGIAEIRRYHDEAKCRSCQGRRNWRLLGFWTVRCHTCRGTGYALGWLDEQAAHLNTCLDMVEHHCDRLERLDLWARQQGIRVDQPGNAPARRSDHLR